MAWSVLLLAQFALAAATIGVAGVVLFLRPQSSAHRALALFLALLGMVTVINRATDLVSDAAMIHVLRRLVDYVHIGVAFSAAYFWVAYEAQSKGPRLLGARLTLLLLALGAILAAAFWPCLTRCPDQPGEGPLAATISGLTQVLFAVVGLRFATRADTDPDHPRARAHWMMGLGFTLLYATFAAFVLGLASAFGPGSFADGTVWPWIQYGALAVAAFPATLAGVRLWSAARDRAWSAVAVGSVALSFLAGFILQWSSVEVLLFLFGLARFAFPALMALAVVRHRLLDSDLRVLIVLRQGVVASAFASVFFVLSETAENVVPVSDALAGIGAAVLIALVLKPLQAFSTRLARRFMPLAEGVGSPDQLALDARLAIYQEQAKLVWEDGVVGARERRVLDNLAARLHLGEDLARRVESAVRTRNENG